jgi:hypothetical protein
MPQGFGTCLMRTKKGTPPRRLLLNFDAALATAPTSVTATDGTQTYATNSAADIDLRPDGLHLVLKLHCTHEKMSIKTLGDGDTGTLTVTLNGGTPANVDPVPVVYVQDGNP